MGEFVDNKFYRGIVTGYNEAFVIDRKTRDILISADQNNSHLIRPWVTGSEINRWYVNLSDNYLIFIRRG